LSPVADDEGEKTIIFEIPEQSDSFQYNDSVELLSAKTLISYSCFCYPSQPVLLKKDLLRAQKSAMVHGRSKPSFKCLEHPGIGKL
jgi:hypothetical protein